MADLDVLISLREGHTARYLELQAEREALVERVADADAQRKAATQQIEAAVYDLFGEFLEGVNPTLADPVADWSVELWPRQYKDEICVYVEQLALTGGWRVNPGDFTGRKTPLTPALRPLAEFGEGLPFTIEVCCACYPAKAGSPDGGF